MKYIDIKDLINNIRNNTIREIDARNLNALNEIKNVELIKYKKPTPGHKKLLNLFNDLWDIILTNKPLESESKENKNENVNENENEDGDEIIKTLLHSNEYAEKVDQNKKKYNNKKIKWSFW